MLWKRCDAYARHSCSAGVSKRLIERQFSLLELVHEKAAPPNQAAP